MAALISVFCSPDLDTRPRNVPVYSAAFADIHFTYPKGMDRLSWAGWPIKYKGGVKFWEPCR